jgi:hypothetical protein
MFATRKIGNLLCFTPSSFSATRVMVDKRLSALDVWSVMLNRHVSCDQPTTLSKARYWVALLDAGQVEKQVVPSMLFTFTLPGQDRGKPTLVLNSCMFIGLLGYLSSRRHGLDRVAFKHVASSFRLSTCVVLVAGWIALSIRYVLISGHDPSTAAAVAILCLVFLECCFLECIPNMPASTQIYTTVTPVATNSDASVLNLTRRAGGLVDDVWILGYSATETCICR